MEHEVKFIVLERIRCAINLLKKSNVSNELVVVSGLSVECLSSCFLLRTYCTQNGKSVLSILKELQAHTRYGEVGKIWFSR